MTFCILDSEKLTELPAELPRAPRATISITPQGARYLITVVADISGHTFYLYSETQTELHIPADVEAALSEFNTDPSVWARLVEESLDADEQIIEEDRAELDRRLARSRATRRQLLGAGGRD